jgi:hypothetical protein
MTPTSRSAVSAPSHRPGRPAALLVVTAALAALVLGGCRTTDRALTTAPATRSPAAESADARSGSADPLAGVEATVDAVERDLDADAGAAGR